MSSSTPTSYAVDFIEPFSLSITQALGHQLLAALEKLPHAPLTSANIARVEKMGGIYQLFLDGGSVYIGKSKDALNVRLSNHHRKLGGRTPGLLESMRFRALYVNEDLDALAPEKMLIQRLKSVGEAPWNQNGFGNKDPGRQRDTSLVKEKHFDRKFPINLDLPLVLNSARSPLTLLEGMNLLKSAMPYNLRFPSRKDRSQKTLSEIDISDVNMLVDSLSVGEWLHWIASRLPKGWMVTALPGYVIIYKENQPSKYGSRQQVWLPDGCGGVEVQYHNPQFDADGDLDDEGDEAE